MYKKCLVGIGMTTFFLPRFISVTLIAIKYEKKKKENKNKKKAIIAKPPEAFI